MGGFGIWLAVWTAAAVVIVAVFWRRGSCGLVAAYVGCLALYYLVGGLLYVLPWYQPVNDPAVIKRGLEESTYAIVAFAVASLLVQVVRSKRSTDFDGGTGDSGSVTPDDRSIAPLNQHDAGVAVVDTGTAAPPTNEYALAHAISGAKAPARRDPYLGADARQAGTEVAAEVNDDTRARGRHNYQRTLPLALLYLSIGVVSYLALNTIIHETPTVTAFAAVGSQLVVVGICVGCWRAWELRRRGELAIWLVLAAVLPMATIVVQGFLGFGAIAALIIVAFLLHLSRPSWRPIVVGLLVAYLALSLFATYFGSRSQIRQVVWSGSGYVARITEVKGVFSNFKWFDPTNEQDLAFIDGRLNQNEFLGSSVTLLTQNGNYAHGETIIQAVEGLVPRALWPSKPEIAGSGDLVYKYAGVFVPQGTAFGVGTILELYLNFGTPGVVVGFLLLGLLLAVFDAKATEHLRNGDIPRFALFFLVAISFLNVVGGSLFELTSSAAASLILGLVINRFLPIGSQAEEDFSPLLLRAH